MSKTTFQPADSLIEVLRQGHYAAKIVPTVSFSRGFTIPGLRKGRTEEAKAKGLATRRKKFSEGLMTVGDKATVNFEKAMGSLVSNPLTSQGKFINGVYAYGSADKGYLTNWAKVRKQYKGQAEYFDPVWSIATNWNKFIRAANRSAANDKTNQQLAERAVKSSIRNTIKLALSPNLQSILDQRLEKHRENEEKWNAAYRAKAQILANTRGALQLELGRGGGGGIEEEGF